YKVYIIVGAENLSHEADDALLKTLEEPPAHVVLVLTTTDARLLPETVTSRCQPIRMGLVATSEIERELVARRGVKAEDAGWLARISAGRPGWAIEAAADADVVEERRQALDWMAALPEATRQQRFAWAEGLAGDFHKSRAKVAAVLQYWMSWWRDLILLQAGCDDLLTNVDFEGELREQARRLTLAQVRAGLRALEEAGTRLRANVNARLALEAMMLALPRAS
ncbi:MAG: DNA polymerase III subunit delta', partial [Chloroflexi bacterium]|nr:DNA polymerase III subunit delta' [Chloroflexota bacterium]